MLKKLISKDNSGFTVVEIIVVLLVIGVLATILIFTANGIDAKQDNNQRVATVKLISAKLETIFAQNGDYPTLSNINDTNWRQTYFKNLDPNTIRDPGDNSLIPLFAAFPTKNRYAYQPLSLNNSTCDNKTIACVQYILTATLTGGGTFSQHSLNY